MIKKIYYKQVNIDLCVNVLFPFFIMILSSIIIIVSLVNKTNNLKVNRPSNQKSNRNVNVNFKLVKNDAEISTCDTSTRKSKKSSVKKSSLPTKGKSKNKAKNVSAMLATNNILFITLTLPIVLFLSSTPAISSVCNYEKSKLLLIKVLCIILMNSNCFINVFIYFFMSSQFRNELKNMLKFSFDTRNIIESTNQGSSYI
jgi:hypothetical protein